MSFPLPFNVLFLSFPFLSFPFLSISFFFKDLYRFLSSFRLLPFLFSSFHLLVIAFPGPCQSLPFLPCRFVPFHSFPFLSISFPLLSTPFQFSLHFLSSPFYFFPCPFCALSVPSLADLGNSSRARDFCRPCETILLKAAVWAGASGTCTRPRCAYSSPSGSWASPALPAFSVPPARQDTRRRTLLLRASCSAEAWLQFGHSLR